MSIKIRLSSLIQIINIVYILSNESNRDYSEITRLLQSTINPNCECDPSKYQDSLNNNTNNRLLEENSIEFSSCNKTNSQNCVTVFKKDGSKTQIIGDKICSKCNIDFFIVGCTYNLTKCENPGCDIFGFCMNEYYEYCNIENNPFCFAEIVYNCYQFPEKCQNPPPHIKNLIKKYTNPGYLKEDGTCECLRICKNETEIQIWNSNQGKFTCIEVAQKEEVNNTETVSNSTTKTTKTFKNRIDSNSDLVYVITILNRGVTLPSSEFLGRYKKGKNENNEELKLTDPFKFNWNLQDEKYTNKSTADLRYIISPKIRSLYFNDDNKGYNFLTKTSYNQIGFISMQKEDTVWNLKILISYLYNQQSFASTSEYDKTKFLAGQYNEIDDIPKVASLSTDSSKYEYGFSYNECPKSRAWKNYSANRDHIKAHYSNRFKNLIEAFSKNAKRFSEKENPNENLTNDEKGVFYSANGTKLFNITTENLLNNIEEMENLTKIYIADYSYDQNYLNKEITDNNFTLIKEFYRFLNYDINTYSMLHTYISIQPLLSDIESIFIDIINNVANSTTATFPPKSKMITFSTNEYTFYALYKLMSYDLYSNITLTNDFFYTKDQTLFPFVDYNHSLQFELWRNRTSIPNTYYITIRQDFENTNKNQTSWLKSFDEFQSWLSTFYDSSGFDEDERKYFCGE